MSSTTHEVQIDGKPAFSTQLPAGMDPDTYDQLIRNMDEHIRTEASAGRMGAEDRFELALRLKMDCPELADKSWRQLVEVDAYKDGIGHINAKYGKSKSAYSNHLTEMRESKEQLRRFFGDRFPNEAQLPSTIDQLVDEWYLDPKREKKGGGKKKIQSPGPDGKTVVVEYEIVTPDPETDDSYGSLVGSMSASQVRMDAATAADWSPHGPEFLNQVNALIRSAERLKSMYITWHRTQGE